MNLKDQIRIHRQQQGLTQEQVADALGVSTPAVNKWEKGSSCPDIALLSPLARLLKMDLNTLFSFHDNLSKREVGQFVSELVQRIEESGIEAGFALATAKLQAYPTCDLLRSCCALCLNAKLESAPLSPQEREAYERQILSWYEQTASGQDADARETALYMLINKATACGQLERAQQLLALLPDPPAMDKQMLQLNLLLQQGKPAEAAALAETRILRDMTGIGAYLMKLVDLNLSAGDTDAARQIAAIAQQSTELFGLWAYNAYVCSLQVAVAAQDQAECVALIHALLQALTSGGCAANGVLFRHLAPKDTADFAAKILPSLLQEFETDPSYLFLQENPDFQQQLRQYRALCG